jgi:hypothetical protein
VPFKSEAQRRFLWAKYPQIAERWAHEYPDQGHLPAHARKKKKKTHKRGSAPALFSRLGLTVDNDDREDCQAAALYAVTCALWPNQASLGAATASINPDASTPNPMSGTQPSSAQPLIPADQPAPQAPQQASPQAPPQAPGSQPNSPLFSLPHPPPIQRVGCRWFRLLSTDWRVLALRRVRRRRTQPCARK